MDLQKARAELEKLPKIKEALQFIDGFDGYKYHSMNNHSSADWLNGALYAWQAKAQAIPDGFVLVPRYLSDTKAKQFAETKFKGIEGSFHHENRHLSDSEKVKARERLVNYMAKEAQESYKAMIEAQEKKECSAST